MILSELIPFLKNLGTQPKKSLSQNFLIDPNVVRKIVQVADVQKGELVLEVGSGPGALTRELLEAGARVIAIEKDTLFAAHLPRFQTADQRLVVHEADFLLFPLGNLPQNQPIKLVANLPYHITAPILEKVCLSPLFSSLTIMVQKEVADRMMAAAGSKDFGSFSLFIQFYTQPKSSFKVGAGCFYPRPKVDSAVVHLELKKELPDVDPKSFFLITRKAFQKRRKMLSSSLQPLFSAEATRKALSLSQLNPQARPEDLSLEQWILFFKTLTNSSI